MDIFMFTPLGECLCQLWLDLPIGPFSPLLGVFSNTHILYFNEVCLDLCHLGSMM